MCQWSRFENKLFYTTQPSTSLRLQRYQYCHSAMHGVVSFLTEYILEKNCLVSWIDSFSRYRTPPSLLTWGLPKNHQVGNRRRRSASKIACNYWPMWNCHASPPCRPSATARTPPRCWRNWRIRSPYEHRPKILSRRICPTAREQCRGRYINIFFYSPCISNIYMLTTTCLGFTDRLHRQRRWRICTAWRALPHFTRQPAIPHRSMEAFKYIGSRISLGW